MNLKAKFWGDLQRLTNEALVVTNCHFVRNRISGRNASELIGRRWASYLSRDEQTVIEITEAGRAAAIAAATAK